ncbi:hypothetical protein B857_03876 [Solibacillus isronensis B3W22]|uniref:Uncharacterized protein n=1 Tax=Solibacillus isronensis B3W22 TaxID=1224748 RepID=K1KLL9_9BACL|nr:hypothetical protein [Solibacillus isronensis]AMO85334.1 hypothetical protein SOLI23_06965 [Solibacillus silvestris]EKB43336.1 hypothetical protein B857_03876 [Solibacillus isronensis B3W22]
MFGFGDIYDFLIIVVLLGVQYFLASRKSFYWGALLPLGFLIWRIYLIVTNNDNIIVQVIIILLGLAFLSGQWVNGRKSVKDKQKKELLKIKVRDI